MCDICPLSPARGCPWCGVSLGMSFPWSTVLEFTFLSAAGSPLPALRGSSCRAGETKAVIALCVKSVKSYIQPRSSFGNFPAKRLGLFGKHALLKAAPARDPPLQWGKRLALDAAGARKAFFGGGNTKMLFVCGEGLCSPEVPTDLE